MNEHHVFVVAVIVKIATLSIWIWLIVKAADIMHRNGIPSYHLWTPIAFCFVLEIIYIYLRRKY